MAVSRVWSCVLVLLVVVNFSQLAQGEVNVVESVREVKEALKFLHSLHKIEDEQVLSQLFEESGLGQVVHFSYDEDSDVDFDARKLAPLAYHPVVQMHGMGDFANNPFGMVPLKKFISKSLNGAYVTNIALGNTTLSDMLNTFIMSMDHEVDTFARAVQADVNLANGFNAIGYSQGNLIIRGYIERYNNPPVFNWVSVHGPLAGVAGVPQCNITTQFCQTVSLLLGDLAYMPFIQSFLAQANYYRQPLRIPEYLAGDHFLAEINNEHTTTNLTFTNNFESLNKTALVKALGDTMIWPNESEWFGFFEDGSMNNTLSMKDTTWYIQDLFGLQTLDKNDKIDFYTTPGNHLQFTNQFIYQMVTAYFTN